MSLGLHQPYTDLCTSRLIAACRCWGPPERMMLRRLANSGSSCLKIWIACIMRYQYVRQGGQYWPPTSLYVGSCKYHPPTPCKTVDGTHAAPREM
jgi:hypothetical protein